MLVLERFPVVLVGNAFLYEGWDDDQRVRLSPCRASGGFLAVDPFWRRFGFVRVVRRALSRSPIPSGSGIPAPEAVIYGDGIGGAEVFGPDRRVLYWLLGG